MLQLFKEALSKVGKTFEKQEILNLFSNERGKNIRAALEYISTKYQQDFDVSMGSEEFHKFIQLFVKTRIDEFPGLEVFKEVPSELIEKYKVKIYNLFKDFHIFSNPKALFNMIGMFGLFDKDSKVKQRIDNALNIFLYQEAFTERDEFGAQHFAVCATKTEYEINEYLKNYIPKVIKPYLISSISEGYYKFLKKMKGNIGRKITDFLCPYTRENGFLELKIGAIPYAQSIDQKNWEASKRISLSEYNLSKKLSALSCLLNPYIKQKTVGYRINPKLSIAEYKKAMTYFKEWELTYCQADIQGMFHRINPVFDEDFYNFFITHQADITASDNNYSKLSDVQKHFHEVKEYYQKRGNSSLDYITIIEYLREAPYDIEFGNQEFAADAKNAGVLTDGYTYYASLLKKVRTRHQTAIPRHKGLYDFTGKDGKKYKVETKILRSTDPLNMLIGESKYNNCCQKYNDSGESCMEHASISKTGSIFVISVVGDQTTKMLTQSWLWVNEQEVVIDNVEQTNMLIDASPKQRKIYEDIIAYAVKKAAYDILQSSKKGLAEYIKTKSSFIETIINPKKKKLEFQRLSEIETRQSLKMVSIGAGYSDIIVADYFSDKVQRGLYLPKDYEVDGYTDANVRYIASGSEEELIPPSDEYVEESIYRDDRLVSIEQGDKIKYSSIKKIIDIDAGNSQNQNASIKTLEGFVKEYNLNLSLTKIIFGEDWYYLYEVNAKKLNIVKFAKGTPRIEDEHNCQIGEMTNVLRYLASESIDKGLQIKTSPNDENSYTFHLKLLQQIGLKPIIKQSKENAMPTIIVMPKDLIV